MKNKWINKIHCGDSLDVLKQMPNEFIDCLITSPPYWGLRDYGVASQLGLEKNFEDYINKLCNIFDEGKRILKKEGTCWVNIGDTYNSTPIGKQIDPKRLSSTGEYSYNFKKNVNRKLPIKTLLQIPSRFSIEMCNRGWILRNAIIWHKPNCMPASIKDRFTVDFEYLFFFVKNKKYYFEQQLEPVKQSSIDRLNRAVSNKNKWINGPNGQTKHTINQPRPNRKRCKEKATNSSEFFGGYHLVAPFDIKGGRNKRCVWKITTKSFKEAHFAVFPPELIETPIKAGCPENGIVLDPFMGAGTTGLVAKKLNRDYIGIELNKKYIKIAEKRIEDSIIQKECFK